MDWRSVLVALLLLYFIPYGLGSYVMLARLGPLYRAARDGELLLALGALAALLWLQRKAPEDWRPRPHHGALLAYVAVLFANCARPDHPDPTTLLGALQLSVVPFVAYGLGAVLVRQPGGSRAVLWGLALAGVLMALPALLEFVLELDSMPPWVDRRFEITTTRATGFLANPIILASVYQMLLCWALGVWLTCRPRSPRFVALGLLVLVLLAVLYISYTRAGWLAFWFASFLFFAVQKPRRPLLLLPSVLLLLTVAAAPTGRMRLATVAEMRHVSNATRLDRWQRCLTYIARRPFVGHGLGRTCGVAPNQNELPGAFFAHNYLLQLWVELGLAGLVPFVAFWVLLLRRVRAGGTGVLRTAGMTALAGFFAHSMVIGHIEYPPVGMLVGLTVALLDGPLPDEGADGPAARPAVVLAPAVGLMVVLTVLQMRVDIFQYRLEQAYELRREGRRAEAAAVLDELAAWDRRCLEDEHDLARRWADGLRGAPPLQ